MFDTVVLLLLLLLLLLGAEFRAARVVSAVLKDPPRKTY
tara:strand:- start:347 stop:463 length:117 start_codon:yes stop_codon:yes gene_type:complete